MPKPRAKLVGNSLRKKSLTPGQRKEQRRLWKLQQKFTKQELAKNGLTVGQIAKKTSSTVEEV